LRKQGVQIVGVMSELGIHKNYRLAQLINKGSVDVLFSAHTHEAVFKPLESASGALVVESGNHGYVGRMDITVTNGHVTARNWTLNIVNDAVAEDVNVAALVKKERAPFLVKDPNKTISTPFTTETLHQSIDTVVGHTEILLTRYNALESSFNNAYTDILRGITRTEVAITPAFRFSAAAAPPGFLYEDKSVATGDITMEDVYRYFPVSYSVSTAKVSVGNLRNIIEALLTEVYSTTAFKQAGGWVSGFSGIEVKLDLAKPDGHRILSIGDPITHQTYSNDKIVSITGCSRPLDDADVLCSYHGFTDLKALNNPDDGTAWTATQTLVYGLQHGLLPKTTRQNFIDVSNTPVWPASGYF